MNLKSRFNAADMLIKAAFIQLSEAEKGCHFISINRLQ
jgi:hypothetical protein